MIKGDVSFGSLQPAFSPPSFSVNPIPVLIPTPRCLTLVLRDWICCLRFHLQRNRHIWPAPAYKPEWGCDEGHLLKMFGSSPWWLKGSVCTFSTNELCRQRVFSGAFHIYITCSENQWYCFRCEDELVHRDFKKAVGACKIFYNAEIKSLVVLVGALPCD